MQDHCDQITPFILYERPHNYDDQLRKVQLTNKKTRKKICKQTNQPTIIDTLLATKQALLTNHNGEAVHTKLEGQFGLNGLHWLYTSIEEIYTLLLIIP